MNWSRIKDCLDDKEKYQCIGDKATYYLECKLNNVVVEKYDADCVYRTLKLEGRIGDCFFRIAEKDYKTEKLILVEAKGKQDDYFEQLDASVDFFREQDFTGVIHGRFVGTKVPGSLFTDKKFKNDTLELSKKFVNRKGTLRFGNRIIREKIVNFKSTELVLNDSKNSKPEIINF